MRFKNMTAKRHDVPRQSRSAGKDAYVSLFIALIFRIIFWFLLTILSPQMGLEEIGEGNGD